jgi:PAS domain S-box-containing protein
MTSLRDRIGLRGKLTLAITVPTIALVTGAILAATVLQVRQIKASLVATTTSVVDALSQDFERFDLLRTQDTAADAVNRLRSFESIEHLFLYDADHRVVFAHRSAAVAPIDPPVERYPKPVFEDGHLRLEVDLFAGARRFGHVFVQVETSELAREQRAVVWVAALAILAALVLGGALGFALQRVISRPIVALQRAAREVTEHGDYSARVERSSNDELGAVALAFNAMLERIEARTAELKGANRRLQGEIEERLVAQRGLRRLEEAIEHSSEAIAILDLDGLVTYVNPAVETISGYTRDEVLGRPWTYLSNGDPDTPSYRKARAALESGDTFAGRVVNRRKDGSAYTEEATISPIRDKRGTTLAFVTVNRDVSDRVALEAQLRQSQKMEAIGRLAGGVAHDFNNILTAVLGHVQAMREVLALEPKCADVLAESADQIESSAQRAAALTRQLLGFSRQQVMRIEAVDLAAVVQRMETMLRRLVPESIQLDVTTTPGLRPVSGDTNQIEQVVLNLVVNAQAAMPDGGRLVVEASDAFLDRSYVDAHAGARTGLHGVISVSDTGVGMDGRTIERIFEPFYTTRADGSGTGLGLALVYGIVKQAGGSIQVSSELGRGSTFKIFLPVSEDRVPASERVDARRRPTLEGTETILVCEDDHQVRRVTTRYLETAGYTVLAADHGETCLRVAAEHPSAIDLLISDVVMPGINGKELSIRLLKDRPDLRVLFISGYTRDIISDHGVMNESVEYLEKPFDRRALLLRVRSLLDRPRDRRDASDAIDPDVSNV